MAKKARKQTISDPIEAELDSLKKLLILFLLKAGTSQDEIALALGIDQSSVSRIFPARKVKQFNKER